MISLSSSPKRLSSVSFIIEFRCLSIITFMLFSSCWYWSLSVSEAWVKEVKLSHIRTNLFLSSLAFESNCFKTLFSLFKELKLVAQIYAFGLWVWFTPQEFHLFAPGFVLKSKINKIFRNRKAYFIFLRIFNFKNFYSLIEQITKLELAKDSIRKVCLRHVIQISARLCFLEHIHHVPIS